MSKILIYVLSIIFLILPGTGYCGAVELDEAWIHYLKGDYRKTIEICRKVTGQKALGDQGRYIMGLAFLNLGRQEEARENFEFVLSNYPGSKLRQELFLGIADSYFLKGEFEKAEQSYNAMLASYPASDYASIAYLRMGQAQRRQGRWKEAEGSFNRIIREYPLSIEIGEAKIFYKKDPFFTVQAGAFSKEENALRFVGNLKRKGYNTALGREEDDNRILYKVKIGRFDTLKTAEEELNRLERDGFSGCIVS